MKAALKRKWVEALRSGKYAQGASFLRSEVGYCCLGVLCKVHTGRAPKKNAATYYGARQGVTERMQNRLANFNDGYDRSSTGEHVPAKTFKQIAAYIERYV